MSREHPDSAELAGRLEAAWSVLAADKPDLAAAFALQRDLVRRTLRAIADLSAGSFERLEPGYAASKLARGVPYLRAEPWSLPAESLRPILHDFIGLLEAGGAGTVAANIGEALKRRKIEPQSWLSAVLDRDHERILKGAVQLGVSPDLLWLIGELAVAPVAHELRRLVEDDPGGELAAALEDWKEGYCPACGSWPAFAEAGPPEVLRCSFCGASWQRPPGGCIYCGDENDWGQERGPDGSGLETCSRCNSYLKVLAVEASLPFPLMTVHDLTSSDLDRTAVERGYGKPPLPPVMPRLAPRAGSSSSC